MVVVSFDLLGGGGLAKVGRQVLIVPQMANRDFRFA
jgi:hypothetical protein